MSPQATAAIYGVVTFALLWAAFVLGANLLVGWPYVPQGNRLHGALLIAWLAGSAWFARAVGQHAARGAGLGGAWRAAVRDLGRAIKGTFVR